MVDPAVFIGVFRQPECMHVRRSLQGFAFGIASGNLRWSVGEWASRRFVFPPPELGKGSTAHQLANRDRVLNAGTWPPCQQEASDSRQALLSRARRATTNATTRNRARNNFWCTRVQNLARRWRSAPSTVLKVSRVQCQCINKTLRQRMGTASLADQCLGDFAFDLAFRERSFGGRRYLTLHLAHNALSLRRIFILAQRDNQPYRIALQIHDRGTAVRLAVPHCMRFALGPALCPAQVPDCIGEVRGKREQLWLQRHAGPGDDQGCVDRQSKESIEDQRGLWTARHVVAGVGVDGPDWQSVFWRPFRKPLDERAKMIFGPTFAISLAPVDRDQRT